MMFCNKCGKEITDDSLFCKFCGAKLIIQEADKNEQQFSDKNTSTMQSQTKAINIVASALTLVGLICGLLISIFMSTKGEAFGYDSWNYFYGGGRETCMGIAVFSGISFLVGLFILLLSKDSDTKSE